VKKMLDKKIKLSLLLAIVLILAVEFFSVYPKLFPKSTLITVVGEGKVLAAPNRVKFTVGVVNFANSAAEALVGNLNLTKSFKGVIESYGVKNNDLVVSFPRIIPQSGTNSYQAINTIDVSLSNISQFEVLVGKLYSQGAYSVSNILFTVDDSSSLEKQAVEKAIENGQKRAEEIALSLGKKVTRIVSLVSSEVGEAGAISGVKNQKEVAGQSFGFPSQIEISRQASIVFELK